MTIASKLSNDDHSRCTGNVSERMSYFSDPQSYREWQELGGERTGSFQVTESKCCLLEQLECRLLRVQF